MSTRIVLNQQEDVIPEDSTPTLRFQIVDRDNVGFKPDKLRLTLWNYTNRAVINGRFSQDVLDKNDVTCDADGNVEWLMRAEDTPIVVSNEDAMLDSSRNLPTAALQARGIETHIARFDWDWLGDTMHNRVEIEHRVQNMIKVPGVHEAVLTAAGSSVASMTGAAV